MTAASAEKRFTPIIILVLVAALVAVVGLWATDKAGKQSVSSHKAETQPSGDE